MPGIWGREVLWITSLAPKTAVDLGIATHGSPVGTVNIETHANQNSPAFADFINKAYQIASPSLCSLS